MKKIITLLLCVLCSCAFSQTRPDWVQIKNRPGIITDTIATLRALPVPIETFNAWVSTYASIGDGGGGLFIWNSTATDTDNYGTVIKPASVAIASAGRWLRADADDLVVNVKHFGAVGDAIVSEVAYSPADHTGGHVASYTGLIHEFSGTDDTIAFQRAYAAMDSHKTLFIPTGNYIIDGNNASWSSGVAGERPGMTFTNKDKISIRGEGWNTRLCVTYDCSEGVTYLENTFMLFLFKGCRDVVVRDMEIDFQCLGWSPANIPATDQNTRLVGAINFWHDDVHPPERNYATNLKLRVNHPFGSYFGDAWAAGKYSTKLIAVYFNGLYADPDSRGSEPGTGALMADDCRINDSTFYNGQPYSVFLWMTQNCQVVNNRFLDSGGQLPIIRATHLVNFNRVEDNYFEVVPRYSDGSPLSDVISFFPNGADYIPCGNKIKNNRFVLKSNVRGISPISITVGTDYEIDNNNIKSEATLRSGTDFYSAIRFTHDQTAWSSIGDAGECGSAKIRGNIIEGLFNRGIAVDALSAIVSDNNVLGVASFGISLTPGFSTFAEKNTLASSAIGLSVQRAGTSATGTAIIKTNHIKNCVIGISPTNISGSYDLYESNIIENCATGTQNLDAGNHRYFDNFLRNNVVDLDATSLNVASGSQSVGGGTLYGNSSKRYTP